MTAVLEQNENLEIWLNCQFAQQYHIDDLSVNVNNSLTTQNPLN